MTMIVDDETCDMIIKKTWCHGQSIMPFYAMLCLWWYFHCNITEGDDENDESSIQRPSWMLLLVVVYLPYWSYLSYQTIFQPHVFKYRTILIGGFFVEICHIITFSIALKNLHDTFHLLMFIASLLFFIETFAFLIVVTIFRTKLEQQQDKETKETFSSSTEQLHQSHQRHNEYYHNVI